MLRCSLEGQKAQCMTRSGQLPAFRLPLQDICKALKIRGARKSRLRDPNEHALLRVEQETIRRDEGLKAVAPEGFEFRITGGDLEALFIEDPFDRQPVAGSIARSLTISKGDDPITEDEVDTHRQQNPACGGPCPAVVDRPQGEGAETDTRRRAYVPLPWHLVPMPIDSLREDLVIDCPGRLYGIDRRWSGAIEHRTPA